MVCPKCGHELRNDETICSHCDKGEKTIGVCDKCGLELKDRELPCPYCEAMKLSKIEYNTIEFSTIGLIRACFPWVFVVMFWITVIGGMIFGTNIVKNLSLLNNSSEVEKTIAVVLGGLVGLIGGFIVAVLTNGVVAAILNMDANLQYLAEREKAKGGK